METKSVRVFFALWPDDEDRRQLAKLTREFSTLCDGRATGDDTLHMTLVFLGNVEESRLPLVAKCADEVKAGQFSMKISSAGYWRHNRVAWAAPDMTPETLSALWRTLSEKLKAAGFKLEDRPYFPHITLVRKASKPLLIQKIEPIDWHAKEFVLVSSPLTAMGSRYQIIGRWPLG